MRICYLSDSRTIHIQRWMKYFVDKGYEIHLISFFPPDGYEVDGVKFHLIKRYTPKISFVFSAVNILSYMIQMRRLLREIKPDIIHAHYVLDYGVLGALSRFHPFVASAWGSDIFRPSRSRVLRHAIRYALKKADIITCDGESLREVMTSLGVNRDKMYLIHHGVDTEKFSPERREKKLIKNLFGKENYPVIVSTRSLEPVYDVETLIKAVPLILRKFPDTRILIVGSGPQEETLVKTAETLNVKNNIKFVGRLPHNELPAYLASSDIYVSTSLSDSFAVSTLEAMACGIPPIISDVGDNSRWIKDGVNGLIFPPGKPEELAKKITCLLERKEERKKFADINIKEVREKADYYKEMERIDNLYKNIVNHT